MSVDVFWYGERGIVNALVTDLCSKPEGDRLAAVQALLGSIDVADGRKAAAAWAWIGQITAVTFLVELNCGQFGSPDLIVRCDTESAGAQVIFLEAKIVPYLGSAMPNSSGARRGFNSAINGQIALKYRLVAALTRSPWSHALAESPDLHCAYSERLDTSDSPRRLEKRAVLDQLMLVPHDPQDRQRFHFVAWTWDREPFWNQQSVTTDLYPCLLNDRNECQWSIDRCRVGWLGFEQVGHADPGPTYSLAVKTMLGGQPFPTDAPGKDGEEFSPPLRPRTTFTRDTQDRVEDVLQLARDRYGPRAVDPRSKSDSISIRDQVRVVLTYRLVEGREQALLGIQGALSPQDWPSLPKPVGLFRLPKRGRHFSFWFYGLPEGRTESVAFAERVFELLDERVESPGNLP